MDDVTKRFLRLQRRLVEQGLDPDYVDLVLQNRWEEVESEADLDALTNLIVKETPEKFRTKPPQDEEAENPYDALREEERRKQERAEAEREARVKAFERLRGGLR